MARKTVANSKSVPFVSRRTLSMFSDHARERAIRLVQKTSNGEVQGIRRKMVEKLLQHDPELLDLTLAVPRFYMQDIPFFDLIVKHAKSSEKFDALERMLEPPKKTFRDTTYHARNHRVVLSDGKEVEYAHLVVTPSGFARGISLDKGTVQEGVLSILPFNDRHSKALFESIMIKKTNSDRRARGLAMLTSEDLKYDQTNRLFQEDPIGKDPFRWGEVMATYIEEDMGIPRKTTAFTDNSIQEYVRILKARNSPARTLSTIPPDYFSSDQEFYRYLQGVDFYAGHPVQPQIIIDKPTVPYRDRVKRIRDVLSKLADDKGDKELKRSSDEDTDVTTLIVLTAREQHLELPQSSKLSENRRAYRKQILRTLAELAPYVSEVSDLRFPSREELLLIESEQEYLKEKGRFRSLMTTGLHSSSRFPSGEAFAERFYTINKPK